MMVSHDCRAVFISNPKCGTRMMYGVLGWFYGFERRGHFHDTKVPAECQDYFKFTIVRNPFDRAVSIWWRGIHAPNDRYGFVERGLEEFEDFIRYVAEPDNQWRPLAMPFHRRIEDVGLPMDAVLQLESVDEQVTMLPFWRDQGKGLVQKTPVVGASDDDKPRWEDIRTETLSRLVREWAGPDFVVGSYKVRLQSA